MCRQAWYCRDVCRDGHAEVHRLECARLRRFAMAGLPSQYHSILRIVLRILVTRFLSSRQEGGPQPTFGSPEWLRQVANKPTFDDMLQQKNHRDQWDPSTLGTLCSMQHLLLPSTDEGVETDLLEAGWTFDAVDLTCRQICNGFSLVSAIGERFGMGCFPSVSLFNHSCAPNAVHATHPVKDEAKLPMGGGCWALIVRAAQDIPAGAQLDISYLDLRIRLDERQFLLRDIFHFRCCCSRCSTGDDAEDDIFIAERVCPMCCGRMLLEPCLRMSRHVRWCRLSMLL
eukprot:gnl/TRDRNA2_/TRDRNA2_127769_c0_seq1.p1 gnl/TRDRNA2_/TRDRNA2_127769_c0~~gnl/TRDRNA2_/TRDRNA2_127769_c0_seq1.p1  ORF type:complete len:285 (+),score=21.40 gnl/TRDRNA2_/TRDRNA2_127769_c0_seq1:194-1048(+)